jgi:hypothetical protein
MSNGYGPSVHLMRLFECTSKQGNKYFCGRLGLASVVLLKSDEVAESGAAVWNLLLQEPPAKQTADVRSSQRPLRPIRDTPSVPSGRWLVTRSRPVAFNEGSRDGRRRKPTTSFRSTCGRMNRCRIFVGMRHDIDWEQAALI